jgi:tetratricopeptide (TPR) repeat protein
MDLNIDFITQWYIWLPIGLALLSMFIGFVRLRKKPGFALVVAWIACLGLGYFTWRQFGGSYALAVLAFLYSNLWIGTRWNNWIRDEYKLSRFFYWLSIDLIPVASFVWGYSRWMGNWVFYLVWTIAAVFTFGFMSNLMMHLFPVVGRQETLRNLTANNALRRGIERDLARAQAQHIQKRSLKLVKRHTVQVDKAAKEIANGKYKDAEERVAPILKILESLSIRSPEQKILMGRIYLLKAKAAIRDLHYYQAHTLVVKARPHVDPDFEIVTQLACNAARANDRASHNIDYCLEYLRMSGGQAVNDTARLIDGFLQNCCALDESSSTSAISAAMSLAEKVKADAAHLKWPFAVIGAGHVLQGHDHKAVTPLETYLKGDPTHWQSLYYLGVAHYHLDHERDSYKCLQTSLSINKDQPTRAAHLLGCLYLSASESGATLSGDLQTDLQQSIQWLQHAVQRDSHSAVLHFDLARAYRSGAQPEKACAELGEALKLNKEYTAASLMLANLLYEAQEWEAALKYFRQVLLSQPKDSDAGFKMGHCLFELQLYPQAIEQLQPLEEENPQAVLMIARSFMCQRQFQKAVERLLALSSNEQVGPEVYYYLGCAQAWVGKQGNQAANRQAVKWFERVLDMNDPFYTAKAHLQLGHIYLLREQPGESIKEYRQAYAHSKVKLEAGIGMIKAYLVQDCDSEAMQHLSELEQTNAGDQRLYYLKGLIYERKKNLSQAEKSYRKAKAGGNVAIILFLKGEVQEAAKMFKQARVEGSDSDRVLYFSGLTAAAEKDYDTAISEWQLISDRHPDDVHLQLNLARAWYLKGCEHYRRSEYDQTAQAWEKFYKVYHVDSQVRENLGLVYLMQAKHTIGKHEAVPALDRARELGLDGNICDFLEGVHRLQSGDVGGAELLHNVVVYQPENAAALYNLAISEESAGNYSSAISHLTQARQCASGELREQIIWALAAAYAGQSDWAKAAGAVAEIAAQ